jgi:hypothetical protein
MSEIHMILKMGTGHDWNGGAHTKAACQAVQDALHDSSIALFKSFDHDRRNMRGQGPNWPTGAGPI